MIPFDLLSLTVITSEIKSAEWRSRPTKGWQTGKLTGGGKIQASDLVIQTPRLYPLEYHDFPQKVNQIGVRWEGHLLCYVLASYEAD